MDSERDFQKRTSQRNLSERFMEHDEHRQLQETDRPNRRRTRLRRLAALLFVLLVVVVWKIWYGTPPRVPEAPVRFERGPDGAFRSAGADDAPDGMHLEFHAGELKSRNNFSSTVAASRSGNARFPSRRIAIFNQSDHLLLQLVGVRLVEHLEKLSYLQGIDYYPKGHLPEPGGLAPDVIVTLDLERIVESGFTPVRELDATVLVTAGNRYRKCRSGYINHLTPPVVDFGFRGELHHESTLTGISSASARYKQVSENIAGEIGKTLAGKFEEFRKQDGPLPELPESFYPPYRPPESIPLIDAFPLEPVVSHHGFMFPSESFWRLRTTRNVADVLSEMARLMDDAGWRTSDPQVEAHQIQMLRSFKSPQMLTVFLDENGTSRTVPSGGDEVAAEQPEEQVLVVHHLVSMGMDDVRRAIDELLDAGAPLETVLTFEEKFGPEQWSRVVERIEKGTATTARAWSVLAHRYQHREETERAREALLRAWVLSRTDPRSGDLQNKLRRLAKEMEIERLDDVPVSPELLEGLGFIQLGTGEPSATMEIGVDEPVRFYGVDVDGELVMVSVRVALEDASPDRTTYALHYAQSKENMSSHGYGGMSWSVSLEDGRTVFEAKRIEGNGEPRFRLEVRTPP